jgi:REP element-mobilizing transposase RayT
VGRTPPQTDQTLSPPGTCGYQPRCSYIRRIPPGFRHSLEVTPAHSHLPHWKGFGAARFLTWRLAGSLPVQRVADFWTADGAKFVAFDRVLDARATGPQWLIEPAIARTVIDAFGAGQHKGLYELGSWVVMPNHVHVLLCPAVDLPRVVRGIKVASAKEANRLLNRTGSFWSRDYFERWVRDSKEERRIVRYIENNPVKAGLCRDAAEWPFSSAWKERG